MPIGHPCLDAAALLKEIYVVISRKPGEIPSTYRY
jgi:hypothetical protein